MMITFLSQAIDSISTTAADAPTSSIVLALVVSIGLVSFVASPKGKTNAKGEKQQQTDKPWPKVAGALPVVGNLHQLKSPQLLAPKAEEWADEYGKDMGCFEISLMGKKLLVVASEERIKEIMAKRPFQVIRSVKATDAAKSVGAAGTFSSEGKVWQADRKLVAPSFNHNHIRDFLTPVKTVMQRLLDVWTDKCKKDNDDNGIVINDDLFSFALDYNALAVLGTDVDSLHGQQNQMVQDLLRTFDKIRARAFAPVHFWKIPYIGQYLDGLGSAYYGLQNQMANLVDSYNRNGGAKTSSSLVGKLVAQSVKDSTFDQQQIIGNLITVLFAGSDSSATSLCNAVEYLAKDDTGFQEELIQEINTKLPTNMEDWTLDDLSETNVPLLTSFVYEVNRVMPAFPLLLFEAAADIPFWEGKTTIEKGTNMIILSRYSGVNPHSPPQDYARGPNGEDNTVFCPRRFVVHDKQTGTDKITNLPKHNSTSFLAFGHGARTCIGKRFALTSLAFATAALAKTFELRLAKDHEPITRIQKLAYVPAVDVRVVMTLRN